MEASQKRPLAERPPRQTLIATVLPKYDSGCLKEVWNVGFSTRVSDAFAASRQYALSPPRLRTLGQDAKARVIARYMLRHCFHGGFEIFVGRIDEKPLS